MTTFRCIRCGTTLAYVGAKCPTCEQRRLSEERNRLLEEQNRQLEEQRKEQSRLAEEQAMESRRQSALLEEERWEREQERIERENERRQQQKSEELNDRMDELYQYAEERNLKPVMVCCNIDESCIFYNLETELVCEEDLYDDLKSLRNKYLKPFNKLLEKLDEDDRVINAKQYNMVFNPTFKVGTLKEVLNSHKSDYVIIPSENEMIAIFPLSMIDNNIKGYAEKKIKIGDFQYLLFLKNNDEINMVAKILSNSTRQLNLAISLINKAVSEYLSANPKPNIEFKSEPEPEFKPVEKSKIRGPIGMLSVIITSLIASLITIILLLKLIDYELEGWLYFLLDELKSDVITGGFFSFISVGLLSFFFFIFFKILNSIKNGIFEKRDIIKYRMERKKQDEERKRIESINNANRELIEQWENQFINAFKSIINEAYSDSKSGKEFIAIQEKQ